MKDEVIQIRNLSKCYGKLVAVKGIDLTIAPGEIFGLIGADGAGKTTTFHILAGVMEATSGEVRVLDKKPRDARLYTGYLTQKFSLYLDLSIDENLRYTAGLRQISEKLYQERRAKYLKLMDLDRFSDRLAGRLSGGMKQKLALCCALISRPKILLLDEPTTGVDPVSRREFWDVLAAIAAEGVTIVVATPYLDEAERCNRIALMHEGEIKQVGTLAQLRDSLGLQRLEVRTKDLETAEKTLVETRHVASVQQRNEISSQQATKTDIIDVQTFGDRLDILVKHADRAEAEVRKIFARQKLDLKDIQVTAPTLENVFVTRLRELGDEPESIPFPRLKSGGAEGRRGGGAEGLRSRGENTDNQLSIANYQDIAIAANSLRKDFGNFQAVKNVDLEIRYGEIYGLLGANGAGKTTTIKILCGLLEPTAGSISLAGETNNLRSGELRRRIGYMSQKFTLYDDLSILQNLEFYCGVYGVPARSRRQKIDWVLATCGLVGKENMLTGQLPGGWKQRVAFGAAVMHEPEILFLDEPTSGVDPLARRQFWRLINDFARSGTAILVTTHYLEEAEQCNRMGFMVAGEMVTQGSPSEIKAMQPGQLIEMAIDRTQDASNLLKTELASWRVSIFGDRLHIVLDNPESEIPQVRSILENSNIQVHSWRSIPFSLEDSFIGIVQRTSENGK
jgi:ABC-2 type transport system ATP-binding protein